MRDYKESDYKDLQKWMEGFGQTMMPSNFLPKLGLIIEGKAAGFIQQTDSDVCYLDTLIANPDEEHDEALDEIVVELLKRVKENGYKVVIALTKRQKVSERAEKLGFAVSTEYDVMFKKL